MAESPLSEREQEVLKLVATGASNKEASRALHISVNTVKVHLRNIYAKLGVASRTEAAMWAVNNGLVKTGETAKPSSEEENSARVWYADIPTPLMWGLVTVGLVVLILLGYGISLLSQTPKSPDDQLPDAIAAAKFEESRWQKLADMPTARAGLAAAAYDNHIYAIAGEGIDGPVGANERYDPMTDAWDILTPKPVPVADVHAGVIGGRIYVPGGRLSSGEMTDILEIYDPQRDTWSRGASLPVAISGYALATFEGKLYLFGGWDGERYTNRVYRYDPSNNYWTEESPMSSARVFAGAAVTKGKIHVVGGHDGKRPLAMHDVYMPGQEKSGEWKVLEPMPDERYHFVSVSVAEIIHLLGGKSSVANAEESILAFKYLSQDDEWRSFVTPMNFPWLGMGGVVIGETIYVVGGRIDGQSTSQHYAYQAVYSIVIPMLP